jgi:hypothetical protein
MDICKTGPPSGPPRPGILYLLPLGLIGIVCVCVRACLPACQGRRKLQEEHWAAQSHDSCFSESVDLLKVYKDGTLSSRGEGGQYEDMQTFLVAG